MAAHRFLAFDLGAESGRAVLGTLDGGRLRTREVRRFPNGPVRVLGRLHWNVLGLLTEIKAALAECARDPDLRPDSLAVDTWGVDFGLLGPDGELLGLPYCYRDARFPGAMLDFFRLVPREAVYARTGVQFLPFNSLFQVYALVRDRSPLLQAASDLLFMPDLFTYLLTGRKVVEATIASTSQLLDPRSGEWVRGFFQAMGFSRPILGPVVPAGTAVGPLHEDVASETGAAGIEAVATAGHDTAAAVAAVPAEPGDRWAYISSGTWSLVGVELPRPLADERARAGNFTNEGGVGGTTRFLRNVSGLWLLQRCRAAWAAGGTPPPYDELLAAAEAAPPFRSLVDPDRPAFLNPPDMPAAIEACCAATGQPAPEGRGAFVRAVLESLALKYRLTLDRLEAATGRRIEVVHVIGGGSRNRLLNRLTADATGRRVVAGPAEATAAGNVLVQALARGVLDSPARIREVMRASTTLDVYEPSPSRGWEDAYRRFRGLAAAPGDEP